MISAFKQRTLQGLGLMTGWTSVPYLYRLACERRLGRLCAAHGVVALTYDDGPGRLLTPKLLTLLRSHQCRATFFLVGNRVETHADQVDRMVAEGHEIGCHTYNHINAWYRSPWEVMRDVRLGYEALRTWIDYSAPFRAPHGHVTIASLIALARRKAPLATWTIDSGDTRRRVKSAGEVTADLLETGGGVVLMHNYDHCVERTRSVLELTDALICTARRSGLRIVTFSELLALDARCNQSPTLELAAA